MKAITFLVLVMFTAVSSATTTITEAFNGISSDRWEITGLDTGVPWSVGATGQLRISKPSDYSGPNVGTDAGVKSKFFLVGDFTVSYNYNLVTWPSPGQGYNLARIYFYGEDSPNWFYTVGRHNFGQTIECTHFRVIQNGANTLIGTGDSYPDTANNTFVISRKNGILSAFVNHGSGLISLGSVVDPYNNKPVCFGLVAQQGVRPTGYRSFTALDVRYSNLIVTADSIVVPEPATLLMLGFGAMVLRKRKL